MGPWPVIALSGGVGGAKLALGLSHLAGVGGENLLIVANVGDDFEHLGLNICPDIDSIVYALSGLNDQEKGWGRADEGWRFMEALGQLGGEDWFNLGDRDLAMHVLRTQALASGQSLTQVTRTITEQLGIASQVVPMTDDPVRTMVQTADDPLAFQHYFVRDCCEPVVTGFKFEGMAEARPQADFIATLKNPDLRAVIITPSNPFVSIDPILDLAGVRDALEATAAPIIAVSPIVAGLAIKGPAAKMMTELGMPSTALAVAEHYEDLIDGFVLDETDAELADDIDCLGIRPFMAQTIMKSLEDRESLADYVIDAADEMAV
jgi:LPPG:FO 2-phospho-L-lactate transferase